MRRLLSTLTFGAALSAGLLYSQEKETDWTASGFGGIATEKISDENGKTALRIKVAENTRDWSGAFLKSQKPFRDENHFSGCFLVFRINGDRDAFGAPIGGQKLQINLMNGGKSLAKEYLSLGKFIEGSAVDTDGTTWQKVVLPMSALGKI
ncbi:MAG: hypothetical protein JNM63_05200, partial [Spirochaetia bacterium]|nr:hypothetical protein [Spirochaetia bacterium]